MKTEKLSLFVVDDNPIALEAIVNDLKDAIHCQVHAFSSAEDCIHRMEDRLPDMILSDYYLDSQCKGIMNGDKMLTYIKKQYPHIPVIMYSSQNTAKEILRLMKLGAADFIPKEKNFLKTLRDKTYRHIGRLQHDHEMRRVARGLIGVLTFFIGSIFLVYAYTPELLPYFIIGGPVLITLWAILANIKQQTQ